MQMRIALAQFTAWTGDITGNLSRMQALLEAGAQDHADLVCFPELCLPGYLLDPGGYTAAFLKDLARAADALESAARDLRVQVAYGTAEAYAGALRNMIVITDTGGGRTGYAKSHMVRAERAAFTQGNELVLTADGSLALGCCYDLAFPGFCASLAEAGAQVMIFPMAWEKQRAFVFEGVAAARAIENVAYVVCANQTGNMGLTQFHGGSRIIDPLGNILLEMGDRVGLSSTDLDLDWVSRLRSSADSATYPLLDDRRPPMPIRRGSFPLPS
jgi:predicted amidohydrolase